MQVRTLARWGAPLALLAVCALVRPANANVAARIEGATKLDGVFANRLQVAVGQKVFIRLTAVNAFRVPVAILCDVPLLKVRVDNSLVPFRVRDVLPAGRAGSMVLAATVTKPGTSKVNMHVLFVNPFTRQVSEAHDTLLLISGDDLGGVGDKKNGDLGGVGDKKDDILGGQQGQQGQGGQQGPLGQQGQAGQGGQGGDTGTLGQTGQDPLGGKKDDTGGFSGGQQQQQLGGKKDGTNGGNGTGGNGTGGNGTGGNGTGTFEF